ncbi:MAG: translation elongation factor 4 [Candidatus Coatesbacteria bacterium]
MSQDRIRNFCIIAHVDHGKSTLADRLLETTGTVAARAMREQVLDRMDLERERGITIKAKAVRLQYKAADGTPYELNLIDTPGHVDFSYEVSRSLAACEGALLVVDAAQGVEAQTVANATLARAQGLTLIPVINKIDLPTADAERTSRQVAELLQTADPARMVRVSAKDGQGVAEVLERIVRDIPPPAGDPAAPLRALVSDATFDPYRGVLVTIRVKDGEIRAKDQIEFMISGNRFEVLEVGIFHPEMSPVESLSAGQVGYVAANIRSVESAPVGDTITHVTARAAVPLPGYRPVRPMVYCSLYPVDGEAFGLLRDALNKLKLNDAALLFLPESSPALGFGFRCGFLGLLHLEIVQERLEREYDLTLVATAPSVAYQVLRKDGVIVDVAHPSAWPNPGDIAAADEPYVRATILTPKDTLGAVMDLTKARRGIFKSLEYLDPTRAILTWELPLAEILLEYYDHLKSVSQGYASLDYEPCGYRAADLVKLDILLNGEQVDALSSIVPKDQSYHKGAQMAEKLKKLIPRQMFEVAIQAAIGSRVIARESIPAMRKNVLAKCYGGDVSRKRKLLEKQKEGKKRMKSVGRVSIPQEAFLSVLKI